LQARRFNQLYQSTEEIIIIIRLHQMHEMLTILTNVHGVCPSRGLNRRRRVQCMPRAVCAGSFSAAIVKLLGPLVIITIVNNKKYTSMTVLQKTQQ